MKKKILALSFLALLISISIAHGMQDPDIDATTVIDATIDRLLLPFPQHYLDALKHNQNALEQIQDALKREKKVKCDVCKETMDPSHIIFHVYQKHAAMIKAMMSQSSENPTDIIIECTTCKKLMIVGAKHRCSKEITTYSVV